MPQNPSNADRQKVLPLATNYDIVWFLLRLSWKKVCINRIQQH